MKTISMANTSQNWYYTMDEHDTSVIDRVLTGKCTIRGIIRESADVGDTIRIGAVDYLIESIKKENSKGEFKNPTDAINALITAECSFSRFINN